MTPLTTQDGNVGRRVASTSGGVPPEIMAITLASYSSTAICTFSTVAFGLAVWKAAMLSSMCPCPAGASQNV